jgi:hypothetical protein
MYGEIEHKQGTNKERNRGIGIRHGFFLRPMSERKERHGQTSKTISPYLCKPGLFWSISKSVTTNGNLEQ